MTKDEYNGNIRLSGGEQSRSDLPKVDIAFRIDGFMDTSCAYFSPGGEARVDIMGV